MNCLHHYGLQRSDCQPQRFVTFGQMVDRPPQVGQISDMTDGTDTILAQLPARLKEARRTQGLSLDAVAKLSGVSRSMVSQIERGESSPTISTLWNLTRALGVDFAGLLDVSSAAATIETLRSVDVPTIQNLGEGVKIRILSPPEEAGKHEVYELIFSLDGVLNSKPHTRGAREHLTVIEGVLDVTSGEDTSRIEAGDTARYSADVPHQIKAVGAARAFLVVQDA